MCNITKQQAVTLNTQVAKYDQNLTVKIFDQQYVLAGELHLTQQAADDLLCLVCKDLGLIMGYIAIHKTKRKTVNAMASIAFKCDNDEHYV